MKNKIENNKLAELLYFYRLKKDLFLTEEKIKENQLLEIKDDQNVLVKFWNKNIENTIRSDELKKQFSNKDKIEKRIEEFLKVHSDLNLQIDEKETKLLEEIQKQLHQDNTSLLKINLALLSILQSNEFVFKEETEVEISRVLFGDKTTIYDLQKRLEKNYVKICEKNGFDEIGKKVLLGIALATTVSIMGLGVFGGATLLEGFTVGAMFSAIVVGGSAIAYKFIDACHKDSIKEEFRKISSEDAGALFAIKATLIEEAKKIMDTYDFKEFLDSNLKLANDLRSDIEFMLLVEKKDVEEAKRKINVFNNWTNRLSSILVG